MLVMQQGRHVCAILAPLITAGKGNAAILHHNSKHRQIMNANDSLKEHSSSENYYQYNFGLVITEGARALAEKFSCFWFLDVIASYQGQLKKEEFQVWTLKRKGSSATITCTNGNDLVLKTQRIPWTDFEPDEATVWVESGTALLPSEH